MIVGDISHKQTARSTFTPYSRQYKIFQTCRRFTFYKEISSEKSINLYNARRRTLQKTLIFIVTSIRISNLICACYWYFTETKKNLQLYKKFWSYPHTVFRIVITIYFFSVALRPNAGHGLLILEVSRSHTTTHHSR